MKIDFEQARAEQAEREATRDLALRLISIGSRALMKEAHPKLASSQKTVAMIKRARKRLKTSVMESWWRY